MGSIERFNLRWEGFEANIKVALKDVRYESEFSDVTLVAGDGKQVKANKVILAGGSSFFFNILRENPHPHPLIYLKGVSHDQLLSLLDFLYTGEASIVEEDLNKFLDVAEDLKIRGLIPPGSQTKSNPSPSVPPQSQGATEEPSPSARVSYPHGATSTTPVSLQNQVAAKEQVTSPSVSHHNDDKFAFIQKRSTVEESITMPKISRPLNVISALQGEVPTKELEPTAKDSHPPSVAASNHDNAFSKATCKENHQSTNVKVEVGDSEHYNVSNGLNDHGEPFIRHVSNRGLVYNEENLDCKGNISNVQVSGGNFVNTQRIGDFYEQSQECQNGIWLSEKQQKNCHVFSPGKQPKQDIMDSSTGVVISEAVDNEHLNYDWYEQGEENKEVVDSNYDMDTTEAVDNIFIHEQSTHACDGRRYKTFSGDLKRHKRTHTGEKQFECLVCFKRFSRMDTLKLHTGIHTGKSHQCLQCSKKFSRKDRLNAHKAIHTGKKPYQCLQCSKQFSRKDRLNAHQAIHTREQSYQ